MRPTAPARDPLYQGYRVPAEIIRSTVWLYSRFHLSHRDSEGLLAERGVQVRYEAIRRWWWTFGPAFGAGLRRHRRPGSGSWTRCSARAMGRSTGCGERETRAGWCGTSCCRSAAPRRLPRASCAACSMERMPDRGRWSRTRWTAPRPPSSACSRAWGTGATRG